MCVSIRLGSDINESFKLSINGTLFCFPSFAVKPKGC